MGSPCGRPGQVRPSAVAAGAPSPEFASYQLDRRQFLVVLGGLAALQASAVTPAWAKHAATTLPSLQPWSLPETMPANPVEAARALVGAAVLAPSYFNAQPWRFEVDATELRVLLDPARTLPLADPDQRFAQMSLGAALENLLVAARAWGQQPSVRYLPWGPTPRPGSALVAASVSWQPAERPRDRLLYSALTERRSNPHPFDGRAIASQSRTQLLTQVGEEVRVHWLEDRDDVRAVAELAHNGVEAVMSDRKAQTERSSWLRDSDGDVRKHGDGRPRSDGPGRTGALVRGPLAAAREPLLRLGQLEPAGDTRPVAVRARSRCSRCRNAAMPAGWSAARRTSASRCGPRRSGCRSIRWHHRSRPNTTEPASPSASTPPGRSRCCSSASATRSPHRRPPAAAWRW
jgi:hypothetical protein